MINKKSFFILIVLVMLLNLAVICASNTEDTVSKEKLDKSSQISQNNLENDYTKTNDKKTNLINKNKTYTNAEISKVEQKPIKAAPGEENVNSYTGLVTAVNNAKTSTQENYTINLQSGNYDATELIIWNSTGNCKTLIINGNNNILNGKGTIQFMQINSETTVILNNINLNNYYNNGNGGVINNKGNLSIYNTTLNNNTATSSGGTINNDRGNINITQSHMTNNQANNGGIVYNWYGNINIIESNLTHNNASTGGAIHTFYGNINITQSNLTYNNAEYGGAIYNYVGNMNIIQSNLTYNNATEGGVMYSTFGNTQILNSSLNNNIGNNGGAIYIVSSSVSITNSTLENNTSPEHGGAIYNLAGNINVSNSSLNNNEAAGNGGAIFNRDPNRHFEVNVKDSNFTENKAGSGAAIYSENEGITNTITGNTFTRNTADNNETLDLNGTKTVKDNIYNSTDILISRINLEVKDEKEYYSKDDYIVLNFTIELANPDNYDEDILEKIGNITLYINDKENITTRYENYTLLNLEVGEYTVYFTSCNQQSNTVTIKVIEDSEITTPQDIYEHYDGINNKIPLVVSDPSGHKGTITVNVKNEDEYIELSNYHNIGKEYNLSSVAVIEALENIYTDLDSSYTINVTYNSEYASPSSTEFTLNIIQKRNTTITYNILNNTEGNVQINITVLDKVYQTPLTDANIQITGDINQNTTTGVLTDNTLTPGNYTITVQYPETKDYKTSQTNIDFKVEIDKDQKISELEDENNNLTQNLQEANNEINELNKTINNLTNQLDEANNNINNLTKQLEDANTEIETLNNIIKELTKPPLNTTITINPIKSTVGSIVNLTANIKDQNGENVNDGKVIFKVNGITLKDERGNVLYATLTDGVATLKYKVQEIWMKNTSYIEAVYGGNKNYPSSKTKSMDTLNISEGLAKISLEKSTFTAKSGETITLRAKIVDANGDTIKRGKVVFKLNGKTITDQNGKALQIKVINGEAIMDYTIPSIYSAKTYTLTAVYGGEGYNRSETSGKLVLTKKGAIINTDSITTTNGKTTVKATITDETGELLVRNTKLAIKVNGKTILKGVNSTNGKIDVSFVTTLRPGMYELQIISGENGIYKTGRMTTVLRI